jgi:hypothetical protein
VQFGRASRKTSELKSKNPKRSRSFPGGSSTRTARLCEQLGTELIELAFMGLREKVARYNVLLMVSLE